MPNKLSELALTIVTDDELRLQQILEQRRNPAADKNLLDEKIWDLFGEEWSIMMTDLVGFSRSTESYGIIHFLNSIYVSRTLFKPIVDKCNGWLLQEHTDNLMAVFRRPERSLECAVAMQEASKEYNNDRAPEEHIIVCIGLGHGEMLRVGKSNVFGQQVNAASKLGEDFAEGGEILITHQFKEAIGENSNLECEELGQVHPSLINAYRLKY